MHSPILVHFFIDVRATSSEGGYYSSLTKALLRPIKEKLIYLSQKNGLYLWPWVKT